MFRALLCPSSEAQDYIMLITTLVVSFLVCCRLEVGELDLLPLLDRKMMYLGCGLLELVGIEEVVGQ